MKEKTLGGIEPELKFSKINPDLQLSMLALSQGGYPEKSDILCDSSKLFFFNCLSFFLDFFPDFFLDFLPNLFLYFILM